MQARARGTSIGPGVFTAVRIAAGALVLWTIVRLRDGPRPLGGSTASGLALFLYASYFLLAYVSLSAATGALLLFGAVQTTMIGAGLARGERMRPLQAGALACALAGLVGLVVLLMPGLAAPPPLAAASMLAAGASWGVYSLRGRSGTDPTAETAGNFVRAVPAALLAAALLLGSIAVVVLARARKAPA